MANELLTYMLNLRFEDGINTFLENVARNVSTYSVTIIIIIIIIIINSLIEGQDITRHCRSLPKAS